MTDRARDLRARLLTPLQSARIALHPLRPEHRESLRAACAADNEIWQIYPVSYAPDRFDASFDALLANPGRLVFAVFAEDALVGMTAYLRIEENAQTLEIGNSYLAPRYRATGLNGAMKRLMIDHAFACGIRRIEFRVDARNTRSQAAVRKIGAVQEGLLRAERITWNGHVRDTCLFGLLSADWAAVRDTLP
ncbi:GNAT family N-acetyltransferase [Sphingobium nicotianae]|uniref:GNAT family N-acetyltransferase n=1 Tax=Sphingobium nicotianae TaxID=2782607 RepID=A0A9X1DDY6_9SPHN|nr:GNAT family protein [Sphingobium nicotianae]MBT2188136.1 GNAT family N-acetyltransferase [Sphingobium nicotianae]